MRTIAGTKYKTTCNNLRVRNKPTTVGGKILTTLTKKGTVVTIYSTKNGWGNRKKNGDEWISMQYLSKVSTQRTKKKEEAPGTDADNTDVAKKDTITGRSASSYKKLLYRYLRAFGSPPKYTKMVDPHYSDDGANVGRVMMQTWYSDPAILSLCPGTVDYLPGFNKKDKSKFWDTVAGKVKGDKTLTSLLASDKATDLNGQLYAFKSAYSSYINVVNLLARTCANFMGIGKVTDLFYGTNVPLNKFDYGFYSNPESAKSYTEKSIFGLTKQILNTAVSDSAYIHFFINSSGVDVSESITATPGESALENILNNSQLSSLSQNLNFLVGGAIGDAAENDINTALANATKGSDFIGSIGTITKNYLKGGRLVFPKMITSIDYQKSINVSMTFISPYGDKRSIYKYTILPACFLLAMGSPKQLSSNMYTYPYLIRAYERGNINTDLAFMSNLQFRRGGNDNTSWTVDNLPTELTATFTITPLYSSMMVTSARNPFLFLQNTSLMEYLGTMCGLDLKANNLQVKLALATQAIKNVISDTPTSLARGIVDTKLMNKIRNFTTFVN